MAVDIDLTGNDANANNGGGQQQNNNGSGNQGGNNNSGDNNNNGGNNANGNENGNPQGNGAGNGNDNGNGNDASQGNGASQQQGNEEGNHQEGNGGEGGIELTEGTTLTVGNENYIVDKDGNLLNSKGEIFQTKDKVQDWLKQFDIVNNNGKDNKPNNGTDNKDNNGGQGNNDNTLNLSKVQELVGIDVLDDKDQPVQFTDDENGIKSYLKAVTDKQVSETANGAVNKFLDDNPQVKDFCNYLIVNNGSAAGYGQLTDSSKIVINKDDASQQEQIVRHVAEVFGNKMVDDNYIKYLKDTGGLYDVAKQSLDNLVSAEQQYRVQLQQEAQAREEQERQATENYWNNVSKIISSGLIGDFKLPEAFTKEVDGRKLTYNRNDFFDYISRASLTDEQGNPITPYQADVNKMSEEEVLNRDILSAWLMFTGGSIKDLAQILVKGNEVRNIKLQAKDNKAHQTIVLNPKAGGYKAVDIAFE